MGKDRNNDVAIPVDGRPSTKLSADVVVYGATAAGVMAAIAATRDGAWVALVEPGNHVGGMVTGGLGHTDYGDRRVVGGLALEFYQRIAQAYGVDTWGYIGPEPGVAEQIMHDWLVEIGVACYFGARIDYLERNTTTITALVTISGLHMSAKVFIDASYEGDLLPRAGISYRVGREPVALYGERWAGRQPILPGEHNFAVAVSPFCEGNEGQILPLIHQRPLAPEGVGDNGVQAYGFRLCLTNRPENQIAFPRPEAYDPGEFELLQRYINACGPGLRAPDIVALVPNLPNGKCDVNSKGPISTNLLDGSSWRYPDADYIERTEIWQRHLRYTQSLFYYLANDPAVPDVIREEIQCWGLCRDEFADTNHLPHQLYVREGRRMLGEHIMTEIDLTTERRKYDTIGMGSYNIDIREVQRIWTWVSRFPNLNGETFNEGYLSIPVRSYAIPYRALLPRYQECDNLIVPVCLSASHVAFASIRLEPQYMLLGHAAGVAAAIAAHEHIAVQQVPSVLLQQRLASQGQVLASL